MYNRHLCLLSAACLLMLAASAKAQQFDENSVGQDYDYTGSEEQPVATPVRPKSQSGRTRTISSSPAVPKAPPVQILKQINRHNEDGSYTYGFEGSDGSFKIETKAANGEVKGKYGYVDDVGKVRVVEYGANRFGFQPNGEGITVPPPTLVDENKIKKKKVPGSPISAFSPFAAAPVNEEPEYDNGQQFEEPQVQPQPQHFPSRTAAKVNSRPRLVSRPSAPVAISRPSGNFEFGSAASGGDFDFGSFQQQQRFEPPLSRSQSNFDETPARPQSFDAVPTRSQSFDGPAPPRIQVPGAVPVSSGPAPPRISVAGAVPAPVPAPRPSSRGSQPRPAPQFLFPQARQATRATARQFAAVSSFDELEKQYALPSGGAATHDITYSAF